MKTLRVGVCAESGTVTCAVRQKDGARATLVMRRSAAGSLLANLQAALTSEQDFDSDFYIAAELTAAEGTGA